MTASVAFALAYHTWADAMQRDLSWSADQMVSNLLRDPAVPSVLVSNPLRSHVSRLRRRSTQDIYPGDGSRRLVTPHRWRRRDTADMRAVGAYRRFDGWLRSAAQTPKGSVLVTCHPVHAAVADRTEWRDVVYYAWDDWLEYPPLRQSRELYAWSYRQIAEDGVKVVAVSQGVVDNIGPKRWAVVPNGVDPESYLRLPPPPPWFEDLPGPIAFYAGALEERVDVGLVCRTARELRDWTFVLAGPMGSPGAFAALSREPNVHINGPVPRPEVLAMAGAADVCIIPHRETPMSKTMSPLKLYEYLGAGTPVVATDLEPIRGVSERCLLVPASASFGAAIMEAADMASPDEESRRDFLKAHSWENRYARWRKAVLSA